MSATTSSTTGSSTASSKHAASVDRKLAIRFNDDIEADCRQRLADSPRTRYLNQLPLPEVHYEGNVDEISYRRGQRYLTTVVDHHAERIVWCAPGRNAATLQQFFDLLGERKHSIKAVSIDMSGGYQQAIRESIPSAEICFDPFHVVRLGQRAVDQVRRDEWNAHDRSKTKAGKWIKGTRWSLLKSPEKQSLAQLAKLGEVQQANRPLYRAFLLKEELRLLYHLDDPSQAPEHLDAWLAWASRSRLEPFVKLARTIRRYRDGILAAIRQGLSNECLSYCSSW